MRTLLLLAPLAGCTAIYDGQYDDRADELEELRSEFLPAENNVKLVRSAQSKLYWVDVVRPLDEPILHSFDPATNQRLDYAWSTARLNNIDTFGSITSFGAELIVECDFGRKTAYDATVPDREIAEIEEGADDCSVDGDSVFYRVDRVLKKWTPATGATAVIANLDTAGVGAADIGGFGVLGDLALVVEGGDLWVIDLGTGIGTWLENTEAARGDVSFDDRAVLYDSDEGVLLTTYADHATSSFDDLVADGGYRLSFKHADIHLLESGGAVAMHGRHVVYRANRGIFAYGIETRQVVDLLLDRGEGFDSEFHYAAPHVTTDGTLFVQNTADFVTDGAVFRVDLSDRLR